MTVTMSRQGLVAVLAALLLSLAPGLTTTAVAAEGKTVTALSAATGGVSGNLAAVPAGPATTITHVAWGDDCAPAGAPAYGFDCVGELVPGDAVVESTLVAGSTAVVTGEGVLEYTPADGFVADTVMIRSADGTRTTELTIQIAIDDGQPLDLPATAELEVGPSGIVESPHLYTASWTAPSFDIAYATLDSYVGQGTVELGTPFPGTVIVRGSDPSGVYAGGTATVTFWSLDGDAARVTLAAPAAAGFSGVETPPALSATVAPGQAATVDVATCAINGRPPVSPDCGVEGDVDFVTVPPGVTASVDGSVVTITADSTAVWGTLLTVDYRVGVDGAWSDPAGITVIVEPAVRLQPVTQTVLTWAGAPVTWDVTVGLPDAYAGGDIVSAVVSDIRVHETGELTNHTGGVLGTLEQESSLLTFTPAPGYAGGVSVWGEVATTYTRTDGTFYTSSAYRTIAGITVLGPVARDDTLSLTVGETGEVDLRSASLWGSTADLRTYGDRLVADGQYEGRVLPDGSESEPVWVDRETSWTATGLWAPLDATRATSGTRLIISETGQADLAGTDPIVTAELAAASSFVGSLMATGTVVAATATAEQSMVAVPFSLATRSGIQGLPATLVVDVSGLAVPGPSPEPEDPSVEPEPEPVVTPQPEPTSEPTPVDQPDAEPVTIPVLAETGPSATVLPLMVVSGALVLAGLVMVVARPRRRQAGGLTDPGRAT